MIGNAALCARNYSGLTLWRRLQSGSRPPHHHRINLPPARPRDSGSFRPVPRVNRSQAAQAASACPLRSRVRKVSSRRIRTFVLHSGFPKPALRGGFRPAAIDGALHDLENLELHPRASQPIAPVAGMAPVVDAVMREHRGGIALHRAHEPVRIGQRVSWIERADALPHRSPEHQRRRMKRPVIVARQVAQQILAGQDSRLRESAAGAPALASHPGSRRHR